MECLDNFHTKEETKKENMDPISCPYLKSMKNTSTSNQKIEESKPENELISKCPFSGQIPKRVSDEKKENKEEEEVDEENDEVVGGCPFIGKPQDINTNFSFFYEIPFYSQYDFYFAVTGTNTNDFLEKTKKLRSFPRHLKYTLFHLNEEKLRSVRQKEFTVIYFVYEEIREKAFKLYKAKKYREAITYFTYAYSCFRWLEFKDKERNKIGVIHSPKLEPILDEDIIIKRSDTDKDYSYEESSYQACLGNILKWMSFSYIQSRHYSEAIRCLDEAIEYSKDKSPELYLRRSQARMFNKASDIEQLTLAVKDAKKAKELNTNKEETRFNKHLEILIPLIEDKKNKEKIQILKLIENSKYSLKIIQEKKLNIDNYIYPNYDSIEMNFKVLEEMRKKYKYAIKFHTEAKNQKQVEIAYNEYESFMEIYSKFRFYYVIDMNKIQSLLLNDDRALVTNPNFQKLLRDNKFKSCEEIFSKASFNFEVFKHSLNKVMEEEKIKKEISLDYDGNKVGEGWGFKIHKQFTFTTFSYLLVILSFFLIILHYLLYAKNSNDKFYK